MTEQPIKRLILKMAVPTIISMLVTTIYNMVDSFYVGHLSTEAVAGVGVSFAYMAFINACGFFFGHGSGNYISRALGAKQGQNAGRMAATGFFTLDSRCHRGLELPIIHFAIVASHGCH